MAEEQPAPGKPFTRPLLIKGFLTVHPQPFQLREYIAAWAASTRFTSPSRTRMGRISSILRWLIFDLSASCHMISGPPASSIAMKTAFLSCTLTTVAVGFAGVAVREVLPVGAGLPIGRLAGDASPGVPGGVVCCAEDCGAEGEFPAVGGIWGDPFSATSGFSASRRRWTPTRFSRVVDWADRRSAASVTGALDVAAVVPSAVVASDSSGKRSRC